MRDKQYRHGSINRPSPRRIATAAGLTLGASLAVGSAAQAATFTVSNVSDADVGSLRAAIDDANNSFGPDTIAFAAGVSGTIELASALPTITDPVDIMGPGARSLTIDANGVSRVFTVSNGPTTIAGLTLTGGATGQYGGAIDSVADLTVRASTITGNTASGLGGAIRARYASLTVQRSTISGNTVTSMTGYGGGIFALGADLTIADSTISGNSGAAGGGGLFAAYDSLAITGSTIVGNTASDYGGGIVVFSSTGSLDSSVVAGNQSSVSGEEDVALVNGGSLSAAFSLLQVPGAVTVNSSDITEVDPQLGPLADNGGATDTMLPAVTSPVVNQGKAFGSSVDQRGLARPVVFPGVAMSSASGADGSDMGAVELQDPTPPAPSNPTPTTTTTTTATPTKPRDPFAGVDLLGPLMRPLGSSTFTAGGKSLTFTTTLPAPGSALFGLDVSFYKGSGPARIARVHKPIQIGNARTTLTKAGQVRVTIPIGARSRRMLKRHTRAKLVVRTYFTTAVANRHVNTTRLVKPARRPR